MKKFFFLIALSLPALLFAQRQAIGNLTVFSEDGDKFFLVLNGEKQNETAQTNIRVEELVQPYYSARVIFKDSTIGSISKNTLYIADANGTMMDVTYKIRKDKSGKAKLNYFSMVEVAQDYNPPAGMYVHRFGHPTSADGGITRTTTTTTTSPVAASVNVNGVSMNVTINDPLESSTTTTTTTHSSSSTTTTNQSSDDCSNSWPMKQSDYTSAKKTIEQSSFEDSKLSTAKSIAGSNCLSSDQVADICKLFSFEDSKLTFAKYAYKHTTDPKNYFKVNNVFSFDASKEELNKFIGADD